MTTTYQGPSDALLLEEGGKVYRPGDSVPLSAAQVAAMRAAGHRFDSDGQKQGAPLVTVVVQPVQPSRPAHDSAGVPIDERGRRETPADAPAVAERPIAK